MATNQVQEIKPATAENLQGPTLGTVSANQTVQGQMSNILDGNSPLMQRAKTRAAQEANKRGLLNSAMGVQAGEEAVLTAALPIAQQDADTYKTQALTNQDWQNKYGADSNAYQFNSALSSQEYQQKTASDISSIEASGAQARLGEEQKYQQQVGAGDYSGSGIIGAQASAEKGLIETKSDLDLRAQTQSETFQGEQNAAEITSREGMQKTQIAADLNLQAEKYGYEKEMQATEIQARKDLVTLEYDLKSDLSTQESEQRQTEVAAELDTRLENSKALIPLESAAKIEEIQAQVAGNKDVQLYASTGQIVTQFNKSVGDINNNADLNQESRTERLNEATSQLNASVQLLADLAGTEISIPEE